MYDSVRAEQVQTSYLQILNDFRALNKNYTDGNKDKQLGFTTQLIRNLRTWIEPSLTSVRRSIQLEAGGLVLEGLVLPNGIKLIKFGTKTNSGSSNSQGVNLEWQIENTTMNLAPAKVTIFEKEERDPIVFRILSPEEGRHEEVAYGIENSLLPRSMEEIVAAYGEQFTDFASKLAAVQKKGLPHNTGVQVADAVYDGFREASKI